MQSCIVSGHSCDASCGNKEADSYYDGPPNAYCSCMDVQQHETLKEMLDGCSPVNSKVGTRGSTGFREPAWRGLLQTELEVN